MSLRPAVLLLVLAVIVTTVMLSSGTGEDHESSQAHSISEAVSPMPASDTPADDNKNADAVESSATAPEAAASGPPLWQLPYPEQVHRIAELRRIADAGVGPAAWVMAGFVKRCVSGTARSDQEIIDAVRSKQEEDRQRHGDKGWSPEKWQQHLDQLLQHEADVRVHCQAIRPDDSERVMDWLELALAQAVPDLYNQLTIPNFPFPEDQAWFVRNAERLALYLDRAKQGFEARLAAGDLRLLERSQYFYRNHQLHIQPDLYRAYVHAVAASQIPGDGFGFKPDESTLAFSRERLSAEQIERGRVEGLALFQRCCSGH